MGQGRFEFCWLVVSAVAGYWFWERCLRGRKDRGGDIRILFSVIVPAEEIPVHRHTPTSLRVHSSTSTQKYPLGPCGQIRMDTTPQNENAAWEDEVSGSALSVLKSQGLPGTKVFLTHHLYYQEVFVARLIKTSSLKVQVRSFF